MAKKRSRRAASPAQMAARARFAAMVKSGSFKKKPKKAKAAKAAKKTKAAKKRAAKKVARKARAKKPHAVKHRAKKAHKKARRNPAKKHHAKKHRRARRARRNEAAAPKAKKSRAKKAKADELGMAAAAQEMMASPEMQSQKARKPRAKKTPAQKRAAKALKARRAKNAKKIKAVSQALKKTRAELKAMPKLSRPKKGEKRGKISAKRRILKTKKATLNLTRSALIGSMSAADRQVLAASGLMRANPSFGEIFSSFAALAPQIGAHAVALAGVAVAGQKIGDMIAQKAPASMPGRAFVSKHAVTIGTVGVAIAAYEAMKHASPKTRPFAGAVLMGGLAAAFVHAAARASWGSKIGLPFAAAPAALPAAPAAPVAGYIDVDGQALAVDGMGEYMALSGNTLTGSSLGEYMALSGNTLTGSSLGEIGQMSEGRQGARALNSPGDPTVEDILDEDEDEGSLSGSIFDD